MAKQPCCFAAPQSGAAKSFMAFRHPIIVITCIRIALSVALLFCPALSPAFYGLYLAAGFSDMIDGAVASAAVVCAVASVAAVYEGYLIQTGRTTQ